MRTSRTALLVALLPAALVALVGGCGSTTTGLAQWSADLTAAQARWQAGALQNYTYELQRNCNCVVNQLRPVTITVRGGALNRIVYSDTTGGFADTTQWRQYLTMDRYFATIHDMVNSNPAHFTAVYTASLGFPSYIAIDPVANILDDEINITTLSFTIDTP
jgi:site-specific recombinase XerD